VASLQVKMLLDQLAAAMARGPLKVARAPAKLLGMAANAVPARAFAKAPVRTEEEELAELHGALIFGILLVLMDVLLVDGVVGSHSLCCSLMVWLDLTPCGVGSMVWSNTKRIASPYSPSSFEVGMFFKPASRAIQQRDSSYRFLYYVSPH
jgi:hypothetical protein